MGDDETLLTITLASLLSALSARGFGGGKRRHHSVSAGIVE